MHFCRTFSFILLACLLWYSPAASGKPPFWAAVLVLSFLALSGAWPLISRLFRAGNFHR
ncbi:MAG: hypothetical protein GX495_01000 [Chloroflexi bacterium]|jgi:hypothetical protein|nr:hypothetical protein [Chloroflexota bacterium]